jgi:small-conductance mechanosensitive channel
VKSGECLARSPDTARKCLACSELQSIEILGQLEGDPLNRQKTSQKRRTEVRGVFFFLFILFLAPLLALTTELVDQDLTIGHLNAIINWYRDCSTKVQSIGLPSDLVYQETSQNLAQEAVRLAFQSAKASTQLVDASSSQTPKTSAGTSGAPQPNFADMLAKVNTRIESEQAQLDALTKQLSSATGSKKQTLLSQRDEQQAELDLDKATEDTIQKMSAFIQSSNESGAGGFAGTINQLERSVPEVNPDPNAAKSAAKPAAAAAQPAAAKPTGLISKAASLYAEIRSIRDVDDLLKETAAVRAMATSLRQPLRTAIATTLSNGRSLADQPAPSDRTQAIAVKKDLQTLTEQFKRTANAMLPLSQEVLVLDQSKSNLLNWRQSIVNEAKGTFRGILFSLITILVVLGLLWALSELWRRWTFRYIHDLRRRRQFLLLRRVVVGFLVGIVLILGVVSDFTSIATFAGFATAGIVVGLQAVLLSVAAYFFVIGRYGIRVGDRVSVAGVTGDVVDVGLVRFYLMELAGTDINLTPTGRIVVFSNAVLFQATTPLFKQIPGTEYTWHEVVLQFAPGANYQLVREKLEPAVNAVYQRYREDFESQHRGADMGLEIQMPIPTLQAKLQFADTGLELLLRYPAELRKAAQMDDEVTRAVLDVIRDNAEIKNAIAGSPKMRAAVRV